MSGTSSIRAHRRQVFFASGRLSCPAAGAAPARVSPPFGRITGSASAMGRFLLVRPSGQVSPDGVQDIPQALTVVGRNTLSTEEQTSELQSLMRKSYAVILLKKKK